MHVSVFLTETFTIGTIHQWFFFIIQNAKIVEKQIGFRPSRVGGVRLELEVLKTNHGPLKVIHNYGHGGSGITLSWGCASEIVDIIKEDSKKNKSHL